MGGMWALWLLFLLLIGAILWWGSRSLTGRRPPAGGESPEEILKRRYARGEIDEDEYEERMRHLRS